MSFDTTNLITHEINLDFITEFNSVVIPVEQYDKDANYICASLFENGSEYVIPEGSSASFGGTKPSSHIVLESAEIEDNKIYYKISEQCTVKEGSYPVKFTLYLPNGGVKYTQAFNIQVRKATVPNDAISDVDEVNILNDLISEATTAIADINTATENAIEATNNAIVATDNVNDAIENANNAANLANEKADLANTKAQLADEKATLAYENAGLANDAATLANEKAELADAKASLANEKADLADTAANNANNIANILSSETLKIFKPSVDTYADLLTTYPNPENGWTVTVASPTPVSYRYNGNTDEWVNLGYISSVETATNDTLGIVKGGGNVNVDIDGTINVDNVSETTVDFTESTTEEDIVSGEKIKISLGKILKSIKTFRTAIGTLSSLTTTVKTSLVAAINELVTSVASKISIANIVNNGVTTATGTVLDGRMGKTLQDQITTLNDNLAAKTMMSRMSVPDVDVFTLNTGMYVYGAGTTNNLPSGYGVLIVCSDMPYKFAMFVDVGIIDGKPTATTWIKAKSDLGVSDWRLLTN